MNRVAVVGSSGAGTSTLAQAIADALDVPLIELDAVMHDPNGIPRPTPEFRSNVMSAITDAEGDHSPAGWVIPGNHRTVSDIVQRRADTVVWIDLPRAMTAWRSFTRSLRRSLTRQRQWGGDRERLRDLFSRHPDRNVVLWSWQHHDQYTQLYESYSAGEFWSHATVHRLRTRREADAFVDSLSA